MNLPLQYDYFDVNRELFEEIKFRYSPTVKEAEDAFAAMAGFARYSSYDHELVAKDAFIKAFVMGRHCQKRS